MIILGIHDGHNAAASLMIDGKISTLLSEERFTYRKNEMGFPENAIRECLKIAGVKAKDIDEVAFSYEYMSLHYMRVKRECQFTIRDYLDEQELYWKPLLFENRVNIEYVNNLVSDKRFKSHQAYKLDDFPLARPPEKDRETFHSVRKDALKEVFGIDAKIKIHNHHDCHKYYAYFGSPFRDKKTLIFTCDGGGGDANGTVSVAEGNKIKELGRNNITNMARIYRYITLLLGMRIGEHEYKVMGLAPYASDYEKRKCDKAFKDIFHVPDLLVEYKNRPKDLFFHFREILADCRFDGIAGSVQEMVEDVGREWFSKAVKKLGISRVVFSGGLSMNVKLNKVIGEIDGVNEFYCPASGGDESTALGASYISHTSHSEAPVSSIEDNFLGSLTNRSEILRAVSKLKGFEIREGVTKRDIAKLIANNIVVGRFTGRMEFGARALGNRSILANPSNPEMVKKINRQIKFRDFWMPFAPSILDKYTGKYIINPKSFSSDHMTTCFDTTSHGKNVLAAALHPADYTVRAHIVKRCLNKDYYELIEEYASITGVGALLNTSFNLHGYPIVRTPEQALHVFENSDLDAIILEDVLVKRR